MKEIPLTKGYVALVDDEDYELINQFKWFAKYEMRSPNHYACRSVNTNGVIKTIRMHRFIMGATQPKEQVDHRDRDTLNNQRSNLRLCTPAENSRNRGIDARNSFGVVGVRGYPEHPGWFQARIMVNRVPIHIGVFPSLDEAATARRDAEIHYFGEFAPQERKAA